MAVGRSENLGRQAAIEDHLMKHVLLAVFYQILTVALSNTEDNVLLVLSLYCVNDFSNSV